MGWEDNININIEFKNWFGTPQTGLTVKITIYEVSNDTPSTEAVSATDMTEVGNGIYNYKFTTRDFNKKYVAYFDGSVALWLDWMRYKSQDISRGD